MAMGGEREEDKKPQAAFLEALHAREGLRRAVLQRIVVDTKLRGCTFEIVTDTAYTPEDERAAAAAARAAVPRSLGTAVRIHKLIADPQIVRRKIVEYLDRTHRAAAACIRAEDIAVRIEGEIVRFALGVAADERGFFEKNEQLLPGIERMLSRNFCNRFVGSLEDKEKEPLPEEDGEEEAEPFDYRPARSFPVVDFHAIDEANVPKVATYLSDCDFQSNSLTVCGQIVYVQERVTRAKTDASGQVKEGRPYLRFTIADATGRMTFSYFPRKKTEEKIRALQVGDSIVCTGANELFNDRLSYTARYINRGSPPPDFVPEKRAGKALPLRYGKVHPEPMTSYDQLDFFGQTALPEELVRNTFVVFDLETTGLVNAPAPGRTMDAITEIGAVKIENGEIRERFTTLVNPERSLTEEIVKLTGITDDMLKDAPKIGEVIGDFCKFCDGCILVGHNVQFDYKFVQYYAAQEEYVFEHKTYDTLSLAQGMLFLPNYKLNTLADYFKISFNHHRAWDDALTTAKIFMELIKAKKCLPNA